MTTTADIDAQVKNDVDAFNNKVYDGFVPQSFLDMFKKAIMRIPPAQHQYPMGFVRRIVDKRLNEHTVLEVAQMINIIYSTPFGDIYDTIEEAISTTETFDKIRGEHNNKVQEFEKKTIAKKNRLMQLSGVVNSTPMKLVHGEA
jgi:hypothetical protein